MPASTPGSTEDVLMYRTARVVADRLCGKMRANTVTTLNLLPSALLVWAVYAQDVPLTVLCVVARMFLDDLDGEVARRCDDRSAFGHYYEHALDALTAVGIAAAYGYTFFNARTAGALAAAAVVATGSAYFLMFAATDTSAAGRVARFVCDDNPTVVFSVGLAVVLTATKAARARGVL